MLTCGVPDCQLCWVMRDDSGLSKILRDTDDLEVSIERNLRTSDVKGLDVICLRTTTGKSGRIAVV